MGHALRADRLLIRPTCGSQAGTDPLHPDTSQERHPRNEVSQVSSHRRRASASASLEPQTEPAHTLTVRSCNPTTRPPRTPRHDVCKPKVESDVEADVQDIAVLNDCSARFGRFHMGAG